MRNTAATAEVGYECVLPTRVPPGAPGDTAVPLIRCGGVFYADKSMACYELPAVASLRENIRVHTNVLASYMQRERDGGRPVCVLVK